MSSSWHHSIIFLVISVTPSGFFTSFYLHLSLIFGFPKTWSIVHISSKCVLFLILNVMVSAHCPFPEQCAFYVLNIPPFVWCLTETQRVVCNEPSSWPCHLASILYSLSRLVTLPPPLSREPKLTPSLLSPRHLLSPDDLLATPSLVQALICLHHLPL